MIYLKLFLTFLKIGAFTFGGGLAMLPLMQEEVLSHGWLTQSQIMDFIAVSESTPGPIAVNMATYIGSEKGGILGALCATLGVVLPSFIIILLVARWYEKFKESKIVKGCMTGLKPAVVGLIGSALVTSTLTVLFPDGLTLAVFDDIAFYSALVIFALSLILSFKKVHPIIVICLSAGLGIAAGYAF